jgi:hypothetical protein
MVRTRVALVLVLAAALAGCLGALQDDDQVEESSTVPSQAVPSQAADWARPLPDPIEGLERVGAADAIKSGAGIWLEGDHAYVAGNNGGFYVANLTSPKAPQVEGHLPEEESRDVELLHYDDGRTVAVLADSGRGMILVDVTDPAEPEVLSRALGDGGDQQANVHNVAVHDGANVVYNSRSVDTPGVDVVDASDPANPEHVRTFGTLTCHDVAVEPGMDRAYCAGVRETQIWDVSDPTEPDVVSRIYNPSIQIHHWAEVTDGGDLLLIGDEFGGSTFAAAGCYANEDVPGTDRQASDPAGALWFYDISDEQNPQPVGYLSPDAPTENAPPAPCTAHFGEILHDRDKAVVGWRTAGTQLVDFSDPSAPRILDTVGTADGENWDAQVHNGWVFSGDTRHGLRVGTFTGGS